MARRIATWLGFALLCAGAGCSTHMTAVRPLTPEKEVEINENRSTFRNLLLQAGAQEFHVNMLTHPAPKQASDFYTRLEMQWPALCEAILRLRLPEGTVEGTGDGTDQKNARAHEMVSTGTDWRGVRDSNPWPPA